MGGLVDASTPESWDSLGIEGGVLVECNVCQPGSVTASTLAMGLKKGPTCLELWA